MFKYPLPENIEFEVKFAHSLILKRSDGIIEVRCEDDFTYDVEDIKQNHGCLKNLMLSEKLLVLNFTERFTSITNNARSYLAEGSHKEFIAAEAFLIHSLPQRESAPRALHQIAP